MLPTPVLEIQITSLALTFDCSPALGHLKELRMSRNNCLDSWYQLDVVSFGNSSAKVQQVICFGFFRNSA
ncbi:unnamed protein product [Allacma fusca]|uniref:Uncharacterized protein n=1 Tax=Allacma fusca TaxID=39272 RepID=A0A8J2LU89_9HEXA|nr:unnamed protein product [Allacma fusca]